MNDKLDVDRNGGSRGTRKRGQVSGRVFGWTLAIAGWMLLMLAGSVLPDLPSTRLIFSLAQGPGAHVIAFGGLVILLRQRMSSLRALLIAGLYSGLLEGLQSLVHYRRAEWSDIVALGIAMIVAWLADAMWRFGRSRLGYQ